MRILVSSKPKYLVNMGGIGGGCVFDGFLFPIPVLSADEVLQYRAVLEELEAQLGGTVKPAQLVQPHLHFKFLALAGRTTESSTVSQKGERP